MEKLATINKDIIANLVLNGDLSKMDQSQKVEYYNRFCVALGLNPLTQPFQIIKFQGKEVLYATKSCTEQLRQINNISVTGIDKVFQNDLFLVTAHVKDANGRTDASTGALSIKNMSGNDLANALMKAETKAKRRATLSICGLGVLDESELETMPQHVTEKVQITETVQDAPKEETKEDVKNSDEKITKTQIQIALAKFSKPEQVQGYWDSLVKKFGNSYMKVYEEMFVKRGKSLKDNSNGEKKAKDDIETITAEVVKEENE